MKKMRKLIPMPILLFFSLCSIGQTNQLERMKREIEIYKDLSGYIYVETDIGHEEFSDTVKLNFAQKDSIKLIFPVVSTYGFVELFQLTNTGFQIIEKKEGDVFNLLQMIIYKSETIFYKIESYASGSKTTVYLNITD